MSVFRFKFIAQGNHFPSSHFCKINIPKRIIKLLLFRCSKAVCGSKKKHFFSIQSQLRLNKRLHSLNTVSVSVKKINNVHARRRFVCIYTQTMSHVIYKSCQMFRTWEWCDHKCNFKQEYDCFYGSFEFEAAWVFWGRQWTHAFSNRSRTLILSKSNVMSCSNCQLPADIYLQITQKNFSIFRPFQHWFPLSRFYIFVCSHFPFAEQTLSTLSFPFCLSDIPEQRGKSFQF